MGGDMANVRNSNLKVPPLKIVLSSANSGGSDRSSSTSPSSESESLDSNLTIISDNQHDRSSTSKSDHKEEAVQSKQERASRHAAKGSNSDKSSSSSALGNKRSHDNGSSEHNNCESVVGREQASISSQRITRSSQRAAQQNKSENLTETNGDDTVATETQDKTVESARKAKRRKGESQDSEQDGNQQVPPPPPFMANICPADYELPLQNSFELYRDIRKRPQKRLMKLINVQPKAPQGFRDYLLNSGPYLLDGNKIGVGIKGGSSINCADQPNVKPDRLCHRIPPKLKYANGHPKFSAAFTHLKRGYDIPKLLEAPKNLKPGSPLYELYLDQERSRQKMRMQHLKERERSILTVEQEILRAYNKAAVVDSKQDLNLSACTYFYLHERYHYIDEKNDSIDCVNPKDLLPIQKNSDENQEEIGEASHLSSNDHKPQRSEVTKSTSNLSNLTIEAEESIDKGEKLQADNDLRSQAGGSHEAKPSQKKKKRASECHDEDYQANGSRDGPGDMHNTTGKTCDNEPDGASRSNGDQMKKESFLDATTVGDRSGESSTEALDRTKGSGTRTHEITDADQQVLNKSAFLDNLQEIDEKWAKIKGQMFIRHKNEADSLFAVQSLDWEWKAKEIGACDVRVALKIEPEFVPRVGVYALDY